MSVTLKWIKPEELSDYLQKGWTEVQLHFRPSGKFLIASPEEPASEPAKVECPNCHQETDTTFQHEVRLPAGYPPEYTCKPAQPEPVAEEMSEAVSTALKSMRFTASNHRISDAETKGLLDNADALESSWRTHAAQVAKVRMTEELEEVLSAAWLWSIEPPADTEKIRDAIHAVRAQAAEAGKVTP